MTEQEREHLDNRILLLEVKIESQNMKFIDATFFGSSEENFALLEKGIIAFKEFLNENHETRSFAFFSKNISKLEDFFTIISRT